MTPPKVLWYERVVLWIALAYIAVFVLIPFVVRVWPW